MISDSELREIYANAPVIKETFEVVTFRSSWFEFHLQYAFAGETIEVEFEDGSLVDAIYAPMRVEHASSNADMNYSRRIVIQQINDLIAEQVALRPDGSEEKPVIEGRTFVMYRDGTISRMKGPVIKTEVLRVTRDGEGANIDTSVKPVNNVATGEIATISRIPMLRGVL